MMNTRAAVLVLPGGLTFPRKRDRDGVLDESEMCSLGSGLLCLPGYTFIPKVVL